MSDVEQLRVRGGTLVNQKGLPIQLKGMSLYWSQWGDAFWRPSVVNTLRENWGSTVVRCPIGAHHLEPGYLNDPELEAAKAFPVINAAIKENIYVIVDCHNHKAVEDKEKSIEMLQFVARKYGDCPNILYEVVNEPLFVVWEDVRQYAIEAIEAVREYAKNAVCLVGTTAWSKNLYDVANNPIVLPDIMYSYHFYAGTHKEKEREAMLPYLKDGLPIFVTECGVSEADGGGKLAYDEFDKWLVVLNQYRISWCAWSLMSKEESSAALVKNASAAETWYSKDLTDAGLFYRNRIGIPPSTMEGSPYRPFFPSLIGTRVEETNYLRKKLSRSTQIPYLFLERCILSTAETGTPQEAQLLLLWVTREWNKLTKDTKDKLEVILHNRFKEAAPSPENWVWYRLADTLTFIKRRGPRL